MNLRENYEISRKAQLFLAANAYLYLLAQSCCLSRLTRAFGRAAVRKAPLLPLNTNRWLHNLLFPCFRILCVSLPESCGNCISIEDTKTDMFLKCSVHGMLSEAEHLQTILRCCEKSFVFVFREVQNVVNLIDLAKRFRTIVWFLMPLAIQPPPPPRRGPQGFQTMFLRHSQITRIITCRTLFRRYKVESRKF